MIKLIHITRPMICLLHLFSLLDALDFCYGDANWILIVQGSHGDLAWWDESDPSKLPSILASLSERAHIWDSKVRQLGSLWCLYPCPCHSFQSSGFYGLAVFTPSVWRWHGGKSSRTSHVQISATMVRFLWKFGCLCFMCLWLASKGLEDWLIVVSSETVHRGFTHQILAYFEDFVPLLR